MPPQNTGVTDSTLLCERCGYVLEGLNESGACPECGKPIDESLPSRRTGTPWQVSPGWRGFTAQCVMLVRRPTHLFANLKIKHRLNFHLSLCAHAVAALVVVVPFGAMKALTSGGSQLILIPVAFGLPVMCVFMLLTLIEEVGVVFFSRKRGWRVPTAVARAVCTNASPGWIVAGMFTTSGLGLMLVLHRVMDDLPRNWWPWVEAAAAAMPVLGFIAGMLVFETLVYIGVRRCRYANWMERPAQRVAGHAPGSQAPE